MQNLIIRLLYKSAEFNHTIATESIVNTLTMVLGLVAIGAGLTIISGGLFGFAVPGYIATAGQVAGGILTAKDVEHLITGKDIAIGAGLTIISGGLFGFAVPGYIATAGQVAGGILTAKDVEHLITGKDINGNPLSDADRQAITSSFILDAIATAGQVAGGILTAKDVEHLITGKDINGNPLSDADRQAITSSFILDATMVGVSSLHKLKLKYVHKINKMDDVGKASGIKGRLSMANKVHPKNGVQFDKDGFPMFKSEYSMKLDPSDFDKPRSSHFDKASKELYQKILKDKNFASKFTEQEIGIFKKGGVPKRFTCIIIKNLAYWNLSIEIFMQKQTM